MSFQGALRSRHSSTAFMLALAFVSAMVTATAAQEYRDDPFQPALSPTEDKKAQERNRLKESLRELFPEIRSSMIQPELATARQQIIDESKKASIAAAIAAIKADPSLIPARAPAPVGADGKVQEVSTKPEETGPKKATITEGAKFVACLNGKALYRDVANSLNFFREAAPGSPTPCNAVEGDFAQKGLAGAVENAKGMVPTMASVPGNGPMGNAPGNGPVGVTGAPGVPSPMPARPPMPNQMPMSPRPATMQRTSAQ